jgi:hypothetical protein
MQTVAPLGMPDRCSADGSGEGSDNGPHSLAAWLCQRALFTQGSSFDGATSALEAKIMKNAHRVGNPR